MADSSPLAHSPTLAVAEPTTGPTLGDDRLAAGVAVGEYVVDKFIGAGAMGEVYAGRHPVIGKRVAIKVLRRELAASTEAAERFIREARAANQIDHDNVVDVFAFGRLDDGRLYLVMDLVEGKSLRAHLVNGPLDLATAVDILEPIADALDAAHARGVVHRDLKPDNIVLATPTSSSTQQRPKVMVLDFGIAKLISTANDGKPTGPGTLTGAGTWLGTPGYMAPEQWSVDGAGPASDRYALGVIAFELLAGTLPFTATSVPAMMEQHFRAEIPSLSSRGAIGLPPNLDAVIKRALEKDPEHRYATGKDLVIALRDAAGTGALRARGAVAPPSGPRRMWIPATAGTVVLGVGIVAVVTLRGNHDRSSTRASSGDDVSRSAARDGELVIDIDTRPQGATVITNKGGNSFSPTKLRARPGDTVELTVKKPGYLTEHKVVQVAPNIERVTVDLAAVDGFQGVWQLETGELRAFERKDDFVDVFKLTAVTGPREPYKRYHFEDADAGVRFGTTEVVVDPRNPNDTTCRIDMRVDYYFDPASGTLEFQRDLFDVDFRDGKCSTHGTGRQVSKLVRVDGRPTDIRTMAPPVGNPKIITKEPTAKTRTKSGKPTVTPKNLPLDPTASTGLKKPAPSSKKAAFDDGLTNAGPDTYTPSKSAPAKTALSKTAADAPQKPTPAPQSQIVPQPNAPAPTKAAEPPSQVGPQEKSPQQSIPTKQKN